MVCIFIVLIVIWQTWPLKIISFDKIPRVGETFDEYAFAWMGKSLLASGRPISWTTNIGAYRKDFSNGNLRGWKLESDNGKIPTVSTISLDYGNGTQYIDLVSPYLDHPPLAGVVYSLGIPQTVNSPLEVKPEHFRFPNRYLSVITAGLLFVSGCLIYSPFVGLIAAGLYSTGSSFLLISRLTMAENVLIPLFLSCLILSFLAVKLKKVYLFVLAGLVAGLCVLTKFSGIAAVVSVFIYMLTNGTNKKQLCLFSLSFMTVAATFLIYGLIQSPNLFWDVMASQAGRGGTWGVINLIQSVERVFFLSFPIDGWWTGGFVAMVYIMAKNGRHHLLTITPLIFMFVATLLGGDNNAWYFFPLGIFIVMTWGIVIKEVFFSPDLINTSLLFLFGFSSSFYWGYSRLHLQTNLSWPIRIVALMFVFSGLFMQKIWERYPLTKYVWYIVILLLLYRLYLWNFRGFQYILSQWSNLPFPLMLTK